MTSIKMCSDMLVLRREISTYATTKMEHVKFFNLLRRGKNGTHVVCTIPTFDLTPPVLSKSGLHLTLYEN